MLLPDSVLDGDRVFGDDPVSVSERVWTMDLKTVREARS
jgi:hypothetical protein